MEEDLHQKEGFIFNRTRLLAQTQKVVLPSRNSSNDSESSYSMDEINEIESIKGENRKMSKRIVNQIMSFKYSSRMLMSVNGVDAASISPFLGGMDEKEGVCDMSQTREEKTEKIESRRLVSVLKNVGRLKCQHRRVRTELDKNLEEIVRVEREKKVLKKELEDLQSKIFEGRCGSRKTSSCVIV